MQKNPLLILSLAVACLGHFLVDVMIGIWPVYKTLAHLDLALAGLIGGICAFLGEGLQILFGSWSDKGYRKILILGGLLATCASVCFVYTNDYLCIFLLYLLTCAGSGAFHPSAASLVCDLSPATRGTLISLFTAGGAFGMAFSQILFRSTHQWFDGHVLWMALPAVLLAILAIFSRVAQQSPAATSTNKHFDIKIFGKFFRQKPLRTLYFTQVCNASMLWGTMFLLPDLLSTRGYEPWISFGGGHMMFILGCAFMMIPAGYIADRTSSRSVILVGMLVSMLIFYALLSTPFLGNAALLTTLFCLGAALGVTQPVAIALGTTLAPNHKGMVSAFLMGMVWCIAEGIGQIGGGFLATCFTEDAPAKSLAILGTIFVIGSALSYQLPNKNEVAVAVETI